MKKLVIFGAGERGISFKNSFLQGNILFNNEQFEVLFCDNDEKKWETALDGAMCYSPVYCLSRIDPQSDIVVVANSAWVEIFHRQLKDLKFKNCFYLDFENFIHKYDPNIDYIDKLEVKSLQSEIKSLQSEVRSLQSEIKSLHSEMKSLLTGVINQQTDLSGRYFLTEAGRKEMDVRYHDLMLLLNKVTHYSTEQSSFSVQTNARVAFDSNDHKTPWGTKNDNTRSPRFVAACERHFPNKKIKHIDLGCSGGGLVLDFLLRGHNSIGLEGSDYSQKSLRATWRLLNNRNLFTADITKPFQLLDNNGEEYRAHIISAWEFMEHIKEDDLPQLFKNIKKHMLPNGIFVGSISLLDDVVNGISYHPTVKPKDWWVNKFSESGLFFPDNHFFSFYDFCRGTGNCNLDCNFEVEPGIGFHFVSRMGN